MLKNKCVKRYVHIAIIPTGTIIVLIIGITTILLMNEIMLCLLNVVIVIGNVARKVTALVRNENTMYDAILLLGLLRFPMDSYNATMAITEEYDSWNPTRNKEAGEKIRVMYAEKTIFLIDIADRSVALAHNAIVAMMNARTADGGDPDRSR